MHILRAENSKITLVCGSPLYFNYVLYEAIMRGWVTFGVLHCTIVWQINLNTSIHLDMCDFPIKRKTCSIYQRWHTVVSELRCWVGRVRRGEYLIVLDFLLNCILSSWSDNIFCNMKIYKSLWWLLRLCNEWRSKIMIQQELHKNFMWKLSAVSHRILQYSDCMAVLLMLSDKISCLLFSFV